MTNYYIDFETKSSVPISAGIKNYLSSPHSAILCMAHKTDDEDTKMWRPGMPVPFTVVPGDKVYAFNALFDYQVWNTLGYRKHLLNELPLDNVVDVMALAGRYTLFQNLYQAGEALNVSVIKDKRGKILIKKACIPPFDKSIEVLRELMTYCIRDVDSMYEVIHTLPTATLSPTEQAIWNMTARMNLRGVPVDTYAITVILKQLDNYLYNEMRKLPRITGGRITTHNQVSEIVKWAFSMGVEIPNMKKETVAEFVDELTGTDDANKRKVLEVLMLRQKLALTSTAKFKKLNELNHEGRIYENLRYHGAATGRWAGMGAQLHNLPRASVEDPEAEIKKFYDNSILNENPLASAKALVRSMICAPPNRRLCVVDYSSIENRILMWVCDEWAAVELLRKGRDPYKDMAADLYSVGYDTVNKVQRQLGKSLILGAGYNLGAKGFRAYAVGYGIELTDNEAELAISRYRAKHKKVVAYWYKAKDTMTHAIQNPGVACRFGKCTYTVLKDRNGTAWLALELPSGRSLFYNRPELKDDKYGLLATHMGINSYTRKWDRLKLIPGRIIENIVQATARDLMAAAKLHMDKLGFEIVLSVHDEIVVECDEDKADVMLNNMIKIMCLVPKWAGDLPVDAEGFVTKRYKK